MFDEEQQKTLRTLVNCIIPADDYPNGWDAGVGDYLYGQFERDLKDKLSIYQDGLTALNTEAQTVYEQPFAKLSANDQIVLLTNIENGAVKSEWHIDPVEFFMMAVTHCAEGYYSNPENGGNRDHVAWDMIGFEVRDERL